MVQKKLTKKEKRKLELLRLRQDPAFFFKEKLKDLPDFLKNFASKLGPQDIIDLAALITVSYYGYKVFGNVHGSAYGIISLELAKSMNLPAGVAGTAGLITLGLAAVWPHKTREQAIVNLKTLGYTDDQISNMLDAGTAVLEEFHPFG